MIGIASGVYGFSGGGAIGTGSVTQHSAHVLSHVVIKPVFGGSQGFRPTTPSAGEILWAIRTILKGPY